MLRWKAELPRNGAVEHDLQSNLMEEATVSAQLNPNRPHRDGNAAVADPFAEQKAGRILAIDFGERRLGLALSDPLGLTAQGLPTAERRNKREDLNFLHALARRHKVSLIVVGNPLNMDGSAGPQSAKARAFAAEVARRVGVAVELWDERLTSVEAQAMPDEARALRLSSTSLPSAPLGAGGTGRSGQAEQADRAKRRGRVDQLAATILLQSFLDTRRARDEVRAATVRERAKSQGSDDSPRACKRPVAESKRERKP